MRYFLQKRFHVSLRLGFAVATLVVCSIILMSQAFAAPTQIDLKTTEKSSPDTGFNAGQFFLGILSASLDIASAIPAVSSTKAVLDNLKNFSSGAKVMLGGAQTVEAAGNKISSAYNVTRVDFNKYLATRNQSAVETMKRQWPTIMMDYQAENNIALASEAKIRDYINKFAQFERELSEVDGEAIIFQYNAATIKASLLYTIYLRSNNNNNKQQYWNDYIAGLEVSDAFLQAKVSVMITRLQEAYDAKFECVREVWDACLTYRAYIKNNQTMLIEKLPSSIWGRSLESDAIKDADLLKNTRIAKIVNDYKVAYGFDRMITSLSNLRVDAGNQHNRNNLAYSISKNFIFVGPNRDAFGYLIDLGEERLINGIVINQKMGGTWLNFPALSVDIAQNDAVFSRKFSFPTNWKLHYLYSDFRSANGKSTSVRYIRVFAKKADWMSLQSRLNKITTLNSVINVLGANEAASGVVALAKYTGDRTWSKPSPKTTDGSYWDFSTNNVDAEEASKIDSLGIARDVLEFSPFSIAANGQQICRIRLRGIMPPFGLKKFNLTFSFFNEFGSEIVTLRTSNPYTLKQSAATIDHIVPATIQKIHKVKVESSISPLRIAEIEVLPRWSDPACN
jgi:hypothetical protein